MTGAPQDGRLLPERIELPGGGWVRFRDEDTLTGRDVYAIRAAIDVLEAKTLGEITNNFMRAAFEVLIDQWEIPGRPNLPVPSADPKMDPTAMLPWKTLKEIEKAVRPLAAALRDDVHGDPADTGPGSPTPPGSD